MSKVLKLVGTIAGIAAAIPGPHQPIAAAVAVAANLGAAVTAQRPVPRAAGSASAITIGADQPSPYMIGDTYSGGAMVHKVGYGPTIDKVPNPYLAMAVVYSVGGPIAGIDTYYADFQPVAFSGADPGEAVGYFDNLLYKSSSTGALLQSTALTGPWGAIPDWTSAAKLSGKAHVLWSAKWDAKKGKFSAGLPQLGIRGRGVLTWDPRADSTYPGGSGTQRWADPADSAAFDAARATWVYTARPGLHGLRYVLGTWERDLTDTGSEYVLTFGVGMPVDQIVVEDFCELETVCEANGWEVSGTLKEPGDKWANLKRIVEAGGAEPCWKGGRLGLKWAAPRVSLDTITRDDLTGEDIRAPGGQPWRDRINTVIPKYTSPDHKWELQQTDKIVVADWLAADGEEKVREEPFEMVKAPTQAAQLAAYRLWDAREYGPVELPVGPRLRRYRGGDRLTLHADIVQALGVPHGEVVVVDRGFDPGTMTGTLTVVGETADKHAAALGAVGTAPPPITIPTPEERDGAVGDSRAAYRIVWRDVTWPVDSDDTSISIEAFTGDLDDGTVGVAFPAGRRSGLASGTEYLVLYDRDASAATTTESYSFTGGTLPTGATLTRASVGLRVNNAGALVSEAADVARFDYDPLTPYAIRGLLVERTSTNLFVQSRDITNASWTKLGSTAATATRMVETAVASSHHVSQALSTTNGQAYTLSCSAKEVVGSAKRYLLLLLSSAGFTTNAYAKFDLATGLVVFATPGITTSSARTADARWRCSITGTATATTAGAAAQVRMSNTTGSALTYTGDGTSSIDITDMQVEALAVRTSPIVTTTTTATRAADVLVLNWGLQDVPDGTTDATFTFDDLSTQVLPITIADGAAPIPADQLTRPRVRSVSATATGAEYVVHESASTDAREALASSQYIVIESVATSTDGVHPETETPPGGVRPGGGGAGVIAP